MERPGDGDDAEEGDEPPRPGVPDELDQRIKAKLLEVLYEEVSIGGYKGPLMVGLHRTMASLQRCFGGEQKELDLPEL